MKIGLVDRDAVDAHRSALRIVEAEQELEDRGFSRAGRADDGDPLSGLARKRFR